MKTSFGSFTQQVKLFVGAIPFLIRVHPCPSVVELGLLCLPEIRGPKENRSPKPECTRRLRISHRTFLSVAVFPFRLSDFGLLSDFGDSDFGVRSSGLIITVTTHRSLFHFSVGRLPRKTNSEKRPTPNTFGVGHELVSRLQGVELSRKNTVPLAGFTVTFTVPAPPPG